MSAIARRHEGRNVRSDAAELTALLGDNSQILVSSVAAASGQLKGGKVRALACFSAARAASLPDVPTMKELGYDVEFYLWVGLFAPKGTPESIVTKIRDFTRQAAMTPKFKELMANIGQEVDYLDQAEFRAFWDTDAKRVEDAVRSIGRVEG